MTHEDKQLLLADLCARLPYGVKVKCPFDDEPYTLLSINWNKEIAVIGFVVDGIYVTSKQKLVDIKPYLRPLSSMSDEEYEEFGATRLEHQLKCLEIDEKRKAFEAGIKFDVEDLEYLYSRHYDACGFIPMGLAIKVTKENNPYEN